LANKLSIGHLVIQTTGNTHFTFLPAAINSCSEEADFPEKKGE
jgi:hypothetical protein